MVTIQKVSQLRAFHQQRLQGPGSLWLGLESVWITTNHLLWSRLETNNIPSVKLTQWLSEQVTSAAPASSQQTKPSRHKLAGTVCEQPGGGGGLGFSGGGRRVRLEPRVSSHKVRTGGREQLQEPPQELHCLGLTLQVHLHTQPRLPVNWLLPQTKSSRNQHQDPSAAQQGSRLSTGQ